MKNDRLFGIIYILLHYKSISAKELAEYFEVSVRTIYRDIDTLTCMHVPIYMQKGKGGGISLLENYTLDKMMLSEEERNELLFSLQGMQRVNGDTNVFYKKIQNFLQANGNDYLDLDFSVWGESEHFRIVFSSVKEALLHKKRIQFLYCNSQGENTWKHVEPLQLKFKYNAWYLRGYDCVKKQERLYKLMRMRNVEITNEPCVYEIQNENATLQSPPMASLCLCFGEEVAYRVYDEFKEEEIEKCKDGSFLVRTTLPENEWLYGYLLSFGEHLILKEPAHIKEKIILKMKNNLKNYV